MTILFSHSTTEADPTKSTTAKTDPTKTDSNYFAKNYSNSPIDE